MKKAIIEIDLPNDFVIGRCESCKFSRGSDQCKLTELLTDNTCSLNCFCPIRILNQPVKDVLKHKESEKE